MKVMGMERFLGWEKKFPMFSIDPSVSKITGNISSFVTSESSGGTTFLYTSHVELNSVN